ncbi:ATP12 family chaperone protein [Hasllibacter sp. MH4015]|uniref:ATP12 family chaperone protein n=1 Tax=Hasllibacter sp. MH4015 TaxID=2854029 RepID=UPI001CD250A6|nr:ATP12 family protein [Hasllibacter sp. MH4015]
MTEWKAKRFWTETAVVAVEGGFQVALDGKMLNTPGKRPLVMPTRALAEAVAQEWDAQEGEIRPQEMPFTRCVNSAVERVVPQHAAVADMLAGYGETDLLCYRAEGPEALTQRQAEAWDPLLHWARETYDAPLAITAGIVPVAQPARSIENLSAAVHGTDAFALVALHDLVTLTGSLVLGLAVSRQRVNAAQAFDLSRIDEDWQIEQWGRDEEADAAAEARKAQLLQAEEFWAACFAK